jgi:hypothetical protein
MIAKFFRRNKLMYICVLYSKYSYAIFVVKIIHNNEYTVYHYVNRHSIYDKYIDQHDWKKYNSQIKLRNCM